ncbi:MAG: hypothetical protein ABIJ12_02895 [bacterium]
MKKYFLLNKLTLLGLAILVAVCALPGCGGDSTPMGPSGGDNNYHFIGSLIKDLNLDIFVMTADLERNDTAITDADISVSGDTLVFNGSYYIRTIYSADHLASGIRSFIVGDTDLYNDTIQAVLPASLTITSILPSVKDPSDLVSVQWTGAAGVEGYIISAVKQGSTYLKTGFSQYVTSLSTSATIRNEAFTINNLSGGDTDPGTYDIFVYAYWGVPDSIMTSALLPVPLPSQLDANIDELKLTGSVGAIVISPAGTVEVIAQ